MGFVVQTMTPQKLKRILRVENVSYFYGLEV